MLRRALARKSPGHAPIAAEISAARTAAHELGHALGLRHVPRTQENMSALMNTGYDGYLLSADEVAKAQRAATRHALPPSTGRCKPPML